jgi:O-antigen ligase
MIAGVQRLPDWRTVAPYAIGMWAAAAAVTRTTPLGIALVSLVLLAACAVWSLQAPSRWLLLFFGALLLGPPVPGTSLHIAPLFGGIGLLAGALRWGAWRPLSGHLALAMLLFLAVLTESTIVAALYSGPEIAAGTLVRVMLFGLSVYVLLYTVIGPASAGNDFLHKARFLFWIGVATTLYACVDFHYQFPAPSGYGPQFVWLADAVLRRAQGVFYDASTLGNLCAFFLMMVVVAMFQPRGQAICARPILVLAGVLFAITLAFSYSRASVLNVLAGTVAFAAVRRASLRKALLILAVPIAAAAFTLHAAFPYISSSYLQRLESFGYLGELPDAALSGRLTSWNALAGFLTHQPWHGLFGIGYKTLPYTRFAGQPTIADNTYLSLLVETGVFGLAVFLILNIAILRAAWRAAHSPRGHAAFFGTWTFCFWTGQMVQMFAGDLITYWRVLPVYFWAIGAAVRETGDGA